MRIKVKKHIFLKKTNAIYTDNSANVFITSFKHKNLTLTADLFQKQFFKNIKIINMKD